MTTEPYTGDLRLNAARDQVVVFRALLALGDRIVDFPTGGLFDDVKSLTDLG